MKFNAAIILFAVSLNVHAQYSESVNINSASDIDSVRNQINQYIFGSDTIPHFIKDSSVPKYLEVFSSRYSKKNVGGFETGTVMLKHGFISKISLFHPVKSNGLNLPVIYHSGHGFGVLQEDLYVNYAVADEVHIKVIDFFLSKGFDVIGIDMPFYGANRHPDIVEERGQTLPMYGHDALFNLENPFYYFMAPIKSVVNYLEQEKGYRDFIMLGLSGGGWSSQLYSAIDPRIKLSFPVAGSIPIPLRIEARDQGDLEQTWPDFYDRFNYSTLYYLGASGAGRRQYQVLNKFDNCCFAFNGNDYWVDTIRNKLSEFNDRGTFGFLFDTVTTTHRISSLAVDSIQKNIINYIANAKLKMLIKVSSSIAANTICAEDTLILSLAENDANEVNWHSKSTEEVTPGSDFFPELAGDYFASVANISGAEIFSDTIEVREARLLTKPSIEQKDGKLYSSFDGYNRWWRDGQLQSTHSKTFDGPVIGLYRVQAVSGNCTSDLSEAYVIGVRIFQERVSSPLIIEVPTEYGQVGYSLFSTSGILMEKGQVNGFKEIRSSWRMSPGIYILRFTGQKYNAVRKVLIR
jgi:pimeloyl-ACP methyl ester carboxylesterase